MEKVLPFLPSVCQHCANGNLSLAMHSRTAVNVQPRTVAIWLTAIVLVTIGTSYQLHANRNIHTKMNMLMLEDMPNAKIHKHVEHNSYNDSLFIATSYLI